MTETLLSFSIGPVQDFIAAARTTRDLWTGSYLLSWLTAQAMDEVINSGGRLVLPAVERDHALLRAVRRHRQPIATRTDAGNVRPADDESVLLACLPNTFVASLPNALESVAENCRKAVVEEWQCIAKEVRTELANRWRDQAQWDTRWPAQIDEFWDIRVTVLPGDADDDRLRLLFDKAPPDAFQLRMQSLAKLAAAQKQIRHFPSHELSEYGRDNDSTGTTPPNDTRPKCSLLGSLAQMGPIAGRDDSQMKVMREFWESVRSTNLDGTRLGKRDRLCAVSLVKRFAWPAVLADTLNQNRDARTFPDIDTICAAEWLSLAKRHVQLDSETTRCDDGRQFWSGHWLRWTRRDQGVSVEVEDPEPCPDDETWHRIQAANTHRDVGARPSYYAVVQLDGDYMGERIRKLDENGLIDVSRQLGEFASQAVPQKIKQHLGSLVYAGGDDVLAFLPASQALACASRLRAAFRELNFPDTKPTCSAAVVVAHYKTPLRLVLAEAREAEQTAKRGGRDCLALRVMKRSGELAPAIVGWEQVAMLEQFVVDFREGATDRWAYRFRQQLDVLPLEAMWPAELKRLLGRAESLPEGFGERVLEFWNAYHAWCVTPLRPALADRRPTWPLSFVHIIQAASFLARGGKE